MSRFMVQDIPRNYFYFHPEIYSVPLRQIMEQRQAARVDDDYNGACQICGENRETAQNEDYAWICNKCYWSAPLNSEGIEKP